MRRRQRPGRQQAHGAALLMAMLTVTLVATFAAAALWQQWRSVEVESAERARAQSAWLLTGMLDFGRLILREDGRASGGAVDHLGEPWAVPLEEARLSTFLAAGAGGNTDTTDTALAAFVSGRITDAQGRFNLTNLVTAEGAPSGDDIYRLQVLFGHLGIAASQADALADRLVRARRAAATPEAGSPLAPQTVDQLTWLGLPPATLEAIRAHVSLLPTRTTLNINTATPLVIAAVADVPLANAQRAVAERDRAHYQTPADAARVLGVSSQQLTERGIHVNSQYFEVHARLRMDSLVMQEVALLHRASNDVSVEWRQREAVDPQDRARAGTAVSR